MRVDHLKKITFRVDGGSQIGIGHIMRCQALGREFKRRGQEVYYVTRFEKFLKAIIGEDFKIFNLMDDGNDIALEIAELKDLITKHEIDVLVIDSYDVSEDYFIKLKDFVPLLCYVDDLNKYKFAVDMIINGNIYAEEMKYKSYFKNTKFLLGSKYTIIRDEFKNVKPIRIKKEIDRIMITVGGSDPKNLTERLMHIIHSDTKLNKYQYKIVIGRGFKNKKGIKKLKTNNITFSENVTNMEEIMLNSDIVISGGGSTLYELMVCGVPTIAIILAENQRRIVEMLYNLKSIEMIGWHNKVSDDQIKHQIKSLIDNYQHRQMLQRNGLKLIDGKGVERIIDEIFTLVSNGPRWEMLL